MGLRELDDTPAKPTEPEAGASGCGSMSLAFLSAFAGLSGLLAGVVGVVAGFFFAALGAFSVFALVYEAKQHDRWGRVVVAALMGALAGVLLLAGLRSLLTPWPFG
ncbi:hypothetical protein FGE12_25780 [Aggregicoccus sp. 17bor-14]|uniref:hypothetical protein n=1 Tax=Myxococcaceae TaxID=31 RepID=UPI00129C6279|nr:MULTISPECIES: hypothetical protein [Myxococcaceae]MBF5045846.1 hypothetical protein [Simulacricoccus sp. 17bor-14]MRI91580.1 hypothetical protein [Aggregicoccus sp. 17bor-14]